MKLVLAGPPRSGKSCLREGLKKALMRIPGAPYPYVITACPDGEGSWFQETVNTNPELAKELKAAYKAKFTPAFVNRISDSVSRCTLPLVLVDIGGIVTDENRAICKDATHMLILAGDPAKKAEWYAFAEELGLVVFADIDSAYHDKEDVILPMENGIFRGSVHYLERGENTAERPVIQALAKALAEAGNDL